MKKSSKIEPINQCWDCGCETTFSSSLNLEKNFQISQEVFNALIKCDANVEESINACLALIVTLIDTHIDEKDWEEAAEMLKNTLTSMFNSRKKQ